eukprot:TRINITY_DN9574_c0_g3_i1.p2 TRINITY_DN9574_c0_g3~~TRINITY_DN9574_c0_g3_i1.p2  ORF type:complete len:101 (-),score=4.66 TRINITY_DN9574_c0_g3_i1:16-318(-)
MKGTTVPAGSWHDIAWRNAYVELFTFSGTMRLALEWALRVLCPLVCGRFVPHESGPCVATRGVGGNFLELDSLPVLHLPFDRLAFVDHTYKGHLARTLPS